MKLNAVIAFLVFGANPAMAYVAGRLWNQEPSLVILPAFITVLFTYMTVSSNDVKSNA